MYHAIGLFSRYYWLCLFYLAAYTWKLNFYICRPTLNISFLICLALLPVDVYQQSRKTKTNNLSIFRRIGLSYRHACTCAWKTQAFDSSGARLSVELFDLSVCQSVNTFMTCSVYITLTVYITCVISWLANPIQTWRTLPWLLEEILDFSVSPYSFSFWLSICIAELPFEGTYNTIR